MEGCKFVDVKVVCEDDGKLLVVEKDNPIPFDIKRIFVIKNVVEGKSRGDHATKKTNLILIPLVGSCKIKLDNGEEKIVYDLNDSEKGLYIKNMVWRSMYDFTKDCVLLAVCDRTFEVGNETYANYEEFLNAVNDN